VSADVAVLIVSYNTERELVRCLESLRAQRRSVTQQVVVVDNASSDGSVAAVRERFGEVELVASPENLGFARGVNLAATRADAELLLLLNPDTVVLDHAVDELVAFARAHPGHGLYGGRTVRPDGSLEPSSCWALPTLWSTLMFVTGLSTLARGSRWLDPESMGDWARDTVREVDVVTGCLMLVPRTAWDELGGFDERYFMYGEDADLALRARAAGMRPIVCPDAVVVHEVGRASAHRADKLLLLFRGKATLMRCHWRGPRRALGLGLLAGGVAVRAALARDTAWAALWRERRTWLRGFPAPAT
jgi:GT2 family glycosyltransferase